MQNEQQTRIDLAACYRLIAYYGFDDLTGTHISARVPGEENAFLLNPLGLFFDEITASSLVKLDFDGKRLCGSEYQPNPSGFNIHCAILQARPDVKCVVHTHTRAGMAVAAMRDGLQPLTQHALRFYRRLGYHEYEGIADDPSERARLVSSLGRYHAMILRNHGLLSAGRTIPEAFRLMHVLETACAVQVDAMRTGAALAPPAPELCEAVAHRYETSGSTGRRDWAGHLRRLDRIDPTYRD